MRVALFSDIHGNKIALDAVIADARRIGVDAFCAVGFILSHQRSERPARTAHADHFVPVDSAPVA